MVKDLIKKLLGIPDPEIARKASLLNEENRLKWVEKTLKQIPGGGRILDAGAGELQFKKHCSHLRYVSQDFGQYDPTELNKGLQVHDWKYGKLDHECDIACIPEPDASFDAIMCTEVFEHIIHPREAIKEFTRLLKPGGLLLITAPFCSLTHFAPYHFYTGFSRFFYETELEGNNYEILELAPNGNYFDYLAQELSRLSGMAKDYSSRPLSRKENGMISRTLRLVTELSAGNKKSEELLCFGYHVLARKKTL